MWLKWPVLAMTLLACSGEGDELEAPMLGDCMTCSRAPLSGGEISGGDGGAGFDANNEGSIDVINLFDVGAPDRLDIVDVGVPNDI